MSKGNMGVDEKAGKIATVVGYCRPIVDLSIAMQNAEALALLARLSLEPGVSFTSDDVLASVLREAELLSGVRPTATPGGPVSNALHSLAVSQGAYPRPVKVTWAGRLSASQVNHRNDPVAQLRRVGVATQALSRGAEVLPQSLCILDSADGETLAIIVGSRDRFDGEPKWGVGQLLLCQLDDLVDVLGTSKYPPYVAIMTADADFCTPMCRELIAALIARDRLRFVIGQKSELDALGLLGPAQWDLLAAVEVVATDGAGPVQIFEPGVSVASVFPTAAVENTTGSYLGAGDAYAGAYISARLRDRTARQAHDEAVAEARMTSYETSARSDYSANLSSLFGAHIDRVANGSDWGHFNSIRESSGTTIISCGNTGVDSFALQSAERWGLAALAVMPAGRRREDNDSGIADFLPPTGTQCIELVASSYRFCTWSNVYLSDGTVLLDFAGGEGSEETRRAARVLNRPIFEIEPGSQDPFALAEELRSWARAHGIRVVNFAGSRGSNLVPDSVNRARALVDDAVRALAGVFAKQFTLEISSGEPESSVGRLGIPALAEVSQAVWDICSVDGLEGSRELLSWRVDGLQLVRAKSRDIVRMVAEGVLDAGLVGGDMVLDSPDYPVVSLLDIGVFNCLVGLVVGTDRAVRPDTIVAQYPRIAMERVETGITTIVPVGGSAESWVHSGIFDGAVDTWRTGKTAHLHGLRLQEELARTTLRLICRPATVSSPAVALGRKVASLMTLKEGAKGTG